VADDYEPARLEIGTTLKQTRQRLGLEIRAVEERTKIRTKYLRALENEEWDVLPAPTYVRGFLRAYAETLGLDGEVLVDEYRRRFEEPSAHAFPTAETALAEQRGDSGNARAGLGGRAPLIAALLAGAVILVAVLALIVGGGGDQGSGAEEQEASGPGERATRVGEGGGSGDPVSLTIVASSDTEVCAVDAEGEALIDAQLLIAGTEEDLGSSRRFQIDLTDGAVELVIDGASKRVEAGDPVTLAITEEGAQPIGYTGPECP